MLKSTAVMEVVATTDEAEVVTGEDRTEDPQDEVAAAVDRVKKLF